MTASFDELRHDWGPLAEAARNVFATPEWAETWWRHYGEGRELLLGAVRNGDALIGVLPLYSARRGPLRLARFVGHPQADELGPVCAPEAWALVADELRRFLERRRINVLLAETVLASPAWETLLGARVLSRGSTPLIRHDGDWESLLRSRSSNFREQARRKERKLAREHELVWRLTESEETLDRDLETLFSLHAARWTDSGFLRARAFHEDFARLALERGWLRLWIMELDGVPRAAWYGFRFAGAECYYQAGRDPEWEKHALGFVILVHTMRSAFDDGLGEYRLLRGGEEYKSRFANEDPGLVTFAYGSGALGRAAVSAARLIPDSLGKRLQR